MGNRIQENSSATKSRTFSTSFEEALSHLKRATGIAVRTGALAGLLAVGPGAGFLGCAVDEGPSTPQDPFLDLGAADTWLDGEGIRSTDMVSYLDSSWHEYYDCNTRGGCMGVSVFLKVLVQPVAGANLDAKRVGVVYNGTIGESQTAEGDYFTTYDDGMEEWHVRVDRRGYDPGVIRFNTWYQDGLGNTYYDDNNGEGHIDAYLGAHSVIYHYQSWEQPLAIGENGVQGHLDLSVADLDYDKDIRLIWTTDNWVTSNEFVIGDPSATNTLHWIEDTYTGYERWGIDLDIDGPVQRFEYALVYRHGVVNDADLYEFWDNNGGHNYVIEAD